MRKRDCACRTYLKLAMLLPSIELPLKTSAELILAYVHVTTYANAHQDLRGY